MDEPEAARQELESAVPTAFRMGSARISLWAQAWLARTQFALGDWSGAVATVERAARQLEDVGLDLLRPLVHWTGAQTQALRGNRDAAQHHLRRAAASLHDYPIMFLPSSLARAQCAEVEADYPTVIRALEPLTRLRPREGVDEPGFWHWPDVYANALVMVGRVDDADTFLIPHEERPQRDSTVPPRRGSATPADAYSAPEGISTPPEPSSSKHCSISTRCPCPTTAPGSTSRTARPCDGPVNAVRPMR